MEKLELLKLKKLEAIWKDPVLWAKACLLTVDNATKKIVPWTARWYQAEMLRDTSVKKVARCGRRTGKTETMCVTALHRAITVKSFRVLFVAPYESQVRAFFDRVNTLIDDSQILKPLLKGRTKTPFEIKFTNGSSIAGFTTGASSGGGAASIRGQRGDLILIDESDYLADADFDAVLAIASEREGIEVFLSSTPTGARKRFWQACTDPKLHYKEFHFPSTVNPNWGPAMEEEFRSQLSENGYLHEVMAEFGSQESGVFSKEKLDEATRVECYAYAPLTESQRYSVETNHLDLEMLIPPSLQELNGATYTPNMFRVMGIDWDKYGASSSIIILDYLPDRNKFKVIRRVEVPKAEYSFDAAVNLVIELNYIYGPKWIYADRGSGEYQIEVLHKYGDEHPETGLKNKVKGFQFSQKIDVPDVTKMTFESKPMKPFMVNQLAMMIERGQLIMSPFDETLHKQLVDYEVVNISRDGKPIFTSKNEHFVDALGLAFLAFVLEWPEITKTIHIIDHTAKVIGIDAPINSTVSKQIDKVVNGFGSIQNPWKGLKNGSVTYEEAQDPLEPDGPKYFEVDAAMFRRRSLHNSWGSRTPSANSFGRTAINRRMF